jgi:hypothetical protein
MSKRTDHIDRLIAASFSDQSISSRPYFWGLGVRGAIRDLFGFRPLLACMDGFDYVYIDRLVNTQLINTND